MPAKQTPARTESKQAGRHASARDDKIAKCATRTSVIGGGHVATVVDQMVAQREQLGLDVCIITQS